MNVSYKDDFYAVEEHLSMAFGMNPGVSIHLEESKGWGGVNREQVQDPVKKKIEEHG